jgi:alcohol dehydrogenase
MPVVNLADTTFGFFIPSVTLIGPGCSKEVGAKAAELGAKKA